ncbi:phospholipase-like protein [Tanacetum coccineum]
MDEEAAPPPTVTIKAKIEVVKEIREALTPTQVKIFEETCFGHWLGVGLKKNSQLLIHTLLTCMVDGKANELSFLVLGKRIRFRRQEFCLVTGLRFGSNMYMKKWVKNLTDNPFRNRIFPHIKANVSVKLSDIIDIFDKMRKRTLVLEDNDAVRICLLVLLQQGFLGHQLSHNVSDDMLKLVEHLSNCWNIFPWGSYIWQYTYSQLRDALHRRKLLHDAKREKGEKIQYTMTGFVWAFMIWILEAIPATHRYVHKQPTEKIPRALAWESTQPFTWSRCCTLFVGDQLAPPLETLTPTKAESETDWWKASLEYFEGKHVQSEVVSEQLDIEKDGISEKKRKRSSSESSLQDPTYDQLMTTVTKLEGTVATLTETVSTLHGTIGTLESRLLTLEGDARVSTLTQTVSSLQCTINTLESRLLALEGDERDFGVVSDGDIAPYMSPGLSYTSPASTAQKSLPLAHRRKLRVRRTPLKLKSPMRCYSRKIRCTIPPPASTTMAHVSTISVPMTTTKVLKDTKDAAKDVAKDAAKDIHIDASDSAALKSFCKEDELQFIGLEKGDKPDYSLPDLSKIKRKKYPIYSMFEKKKTDCYLDCLPKGLICEPSFWDVLYPGGEKAEYLEEGKLDGLHINAFIELMMRKRPHNAQWTLGLSELVAFHIDSGMRLSMVSVVDALRATIDGTNPRYPSWHKISQVFFPINLGNKHWVAAAWNLDDYVLMVYDSLESPENGEKIVDLLKIWKDFIKKDLENMNWFENTKRDPKCFKISLRYMSDVPKQSFVYGTLDCGVMTCKFLEMLTKGKNIDIKSFGDNVGLKCQEYRAKMALMLYETRCERAV